MRATVLFVAAASLAVVALLSVFIASADPAQDPAIPMLPEGVALAGWLLVGLAVLATAGNALVAEWKRRRSAASERRDRPVSLWPLLLVSAAALVATLGLAALAMSFMRPPSESPTAAAPPSAQPRPEEQEPAEEEVTAARPSIDAKTLGPYGLALLIAGTAALIVVLVVRAARGNGGLTAESEEPEALRRELAAGLRMSLEAILAEGDLRRAVIACYARMEQSFAQAGFPRSPAETPLEYLDRVMRESRAVAATHERTLSQALGSLTGLYEVARFSEHPVLSEERSRAVEALGELERIVGAGMVPASGNPS